MDFLNERYEEMYELTSKLQNALVQVHLHLQKLMSLSKNKDNKFKDDQEQLENRSFLEDIGIVNKPKDNNPQELQQILEVLEAPTLRKEIIFSNNLVNDSKAIPAKNMAKIKQRLDALKLKAPLSPFFLFMKEKRDVLKQQYPQLSSIQLAKLFGKVWNTFTAEQRKPYIDSFARSQSNYLNFMMKINQKLDAN